MRILIVDDNAAMRKVLGAVLTGAGHEVLGAYGDGNGLEERIRALSPDLVCLDYQLPGRDGLALLSAIHASTPNIDVVFMTASQEAGLAERAADAGASGFIRKPFSQTQIIDELRDVAAARELAEKAERGPRAATGNDATMPSGSKPTAVIADDNGSVRLVLKGLLEAAGIRVVQSVANGAEALQAAKTHRPRVMCLDVNMPIMGGLEALPQIIEASPSTSVIMVTGCADRFLVSQAAGLGAVGYIIKPLRPAYVEAFVQKLLSA